MLVLLHERSGKKSSRARQHFRDSGHNPAESWPAFYGTTAIPHARENKPVTALFRRPVGFALVGVSYAGELRFGLAWGNLRKKFSNSVSRKRGPQWRSGKSYSEQICGKQRELNRAAMSQGLSRQRH